MYTQISLMIIRDGYDVVMNLALYTFIKIRAPSRSTDAGNAQTSIQVCLAKQKGHELPRRE